ncbi:type II secretion system protein [Vibrio sp. SCSIO 43137]|uniref:type II secretion system protein n=1 Tax=Vibrio sp. SCSIO 43137 TaxID=3021011 RepID=UPI0023078B5E|nr:type II secretion system protein [Vibrio sp. SCSIO 43137]WCE30007.1 type II secretion system protein [Vibrio sp. SCSIO 43137]
MKRQAGFTLIELVVVIVILGILAVTAAPRFLNLQKDARVASLEGMRGAIQGASGMVYGKSAIEGEESKAKGASPAPSVDASGSTVLTSYGYPTAADGGIGNAVVGLQSATDWARFTDGTTNTYVITFQASTALADAAAVKATKCYITYTEATSGTVPAAVAITDSSGC